MILWSEILAFVLLAAGLTIYLELDARKTERKREQEREQDIWDQMFWNGRKSDAGVGERKRLQ